MDKLQKNCLTNPVSSMRYVYVWRKSMHAIVAALRNLCDAIIFPCLVMWILGVNPIRYYLHWCKWFIHTVLYVYWYHRHLHGLSTLAAEGTKYPGPIFTKRYDVLLPNLVKTRSPRLGIKTTVSLWNLTGVSTAVLPRCLSNFRAIRKVCTRMSRLRDFTCGKTSVRLVNKGPGQCVWASQALARPQAQCICIKYQVEPSLSTWRSNSSWLFWLCL